MVSWNVNRSPSSTLGFLLEDISSPVKWDTITLQELTVCPSECDGSDFRSRASSVSVQSPESSSAVGPPPTAATASPGPRAELSPPIQHEVISNCSDFSATVIVHESHTHAIRWRGFSRFATAVLIGGEQPWLVVSAYLPQQGLGHKIFLEALLDVQDLIKSAPAKFRSSKTFLGLDANCSIASHEAISHLVGPQTLASSNSPRAEAFLDLLMSLHLKAANTFRPASDGAANVSCSDSFGASWTHQWYGSSTVRNQIDFILVPLNLDVSCSVNYTLDSSTDHRPLVCRAREPLPPSLKRVRARGSKGWRPTDASAEHAFCEKMNRLAPDSSPNAIQTALVEAAFSVPYTTLSQRQRVQQLVEPAHVLEARTALAACTSVDDRLYWGKQLYRRRRKWLQWAARQRYAANAMRLDRSDRSASSKVSWLSDPLGGKSYDVPSWGDDIIGPFYSKLFTSSLESLEDKRVRLEGMESTLRAQRLDGTHHHIELPMFILVETRARMHPNKQAGQDGLVAEMLQLLDWPALDVIRLSFEKRLNGVPGCCEVVPDWAKILVHCLPKCRAAHQMTNLRPISLISALGKWYLSCLARLIRLHSLPHTCHLLGFEPGKQTMELTELCGMLLAKCSEWRLPLFIGKSDVHKAFDSMEHGKLDTSLQRKNVPLALRAATLRELVEVALEFRFQGASSPPVDLGKGGKQGGGDTPTYWNYYLDAALAETVLQWIELRWGIDLEDGLPPISHAIWADDIFFFASSFETFVSMAQDLTHALNDFGLQWKAGSLSFLVNETGALQLPDVSPNAFPVLDRSGYPWWFERKETLPCLGVLLSPSGSTETAIEYRITAGQQHYWARSDQVTCRAVPKRARVSRLYQTVGSTILWGAGGWIPTAKLLSRLESLELSLLRRIIAHPRGSDGFVAYMKKSALAARRALERFGQTGLAAMVFSKIFGWAGHLARLQRDTPVARVLRFRNLQWWRDMQASMPRLDPSNTTSWRHHRPGRFPRWEDLLERFCPEWLFVAQDREQWRKLMPRFVSASLHALGSRNSLYTLAPRNSPGPALDTGPVAKPPAADLTPENQASVPRLLSSLSAPLTSFWSSGLRAENLAEVTVSCIGVLSTVQPTLLGHRTTVDPEFTELRARILPILRSVANSCASLPADVLKGASGPVLQAARDQASVALRTKTSAESPKAWPTDFPLRSTYAIRAHYASDCARDGSGAVGVCLSVSGGSRVFEIYSCRVFLGTHCKLFSAECQACGIALLALASFLAWLAERRRA